MVVLIAQELKNCGNTVDDFEVTLTNGLRKILN